jgi:outer membrane protein OmpA-like peptidoglycan-associated protein
MFVVLALVLSGCGLPRDVIVLVPDEGGKVGGIVVSKAGAQHELSGSYAAIGTATPAQPNEIFSADQRTVESAFAGALAAKPRPPKVYTILFVLGQFEVDPAGFDTMTEAVAAARATANADITVTGHADAIGDDVSNRALSLRRAQAIYNALVSAGVRPSVIDLEYHGSSNPAIAAANGVPEPRNRRVEVTIR